MSRILAILVAIACCWAGDAAPGAAPKLPAAAQAALDRLDKAEAKLEVEHRKALSAERAKAIAELERVQKTVTKAGDLDGALAVKARIEELQKAEAVDADALLGEKPAAKVDAQRAAPGRWELAKGGGNAICTLREDGSVTAMLGQLPVPGRWRAEKGRLIITWFGDEARWENLAFEGPDRLVGDSFDAGKGGVSMNRLPNAPPTPPGPPSRR